MGVDELGVDEMAGNQQRLGGNLGRSNVLVSVGQRLHGLHSHPGVQQLCCPLTRPTVLGEWTPSFRALIKILWCLWAGLWLPAAINPSFRKSPRYTLVSSVKF